MIEHAILGTDFSKAIQKIIEHSGMFKAVGIKKITLIHVLNLRDLSLVEQFTLEGLEEKLQKQKEILLQNGFEVSAELIYGIPHIELEKKRKECGADVTVVGSHGRTSSSSTIGGTIADVLQNLNAPVLVIPLEKADSAEKEIPGENFFQYEQIMRQLEKQEPNWNLKSTELAGHVLLPTDFSDFSENTFQRIKNLNAKLPKVTLMHVQDEVKIGKHLEHKLDEFNRIDTERLTRLKNTLMEAHPETSVEIKIEYGKPIPLILDFIRQNKVSLTAMGSQGRGFFAEIFIGSVSHQVARKAYSNVLVVPFPKK